jgi:hypothetical protein
MRRRLIAAVITLAALAGPVAVTAASATAASPAAAPQMFMRG